MPERWVFGRRANLLALGSMAFVAIGLVVAIWVPTTAVSSWLFTEEYQARPQPIPFSHNHHVHEVGIDCRFCHTSVMESSFAGLPPTETCMNCHWQILRNAPALRPVHESWETGKPIAWTRVYRLPGYTYFDHAVHLAGGIGCSSCHGRTDRMRITRKAVPMTMDWCLDCHENPWPQLRPRDRLFDMEWERSATTPEEGKRLAEGRHIDTHFLQDCYTCHR